MVRAGTRPGSGAGETEGPVQDANRVGSADHEARAGTVEGDADQGVAVPASLEEQAVPRSRGKARLDADRPRIGTEQRGAVPPPVTAMPGSRGDPICPPVHYRAEERRLHRGAAER